jgi:hypothetical protein
VVSYTPGHFNPWERGLVLLDRRLGGLQSQSECCTIEKNLLPLLGIILHLSSLKPVAILTILTELSRLPVSDTNIIYYETWYISQTANVLKYVLSLNLPGQTENVHKSSHL